MLRGSKGIELAELDLFALALFAGLLAVAFWRSEKWMHQHVFKVGWLLSRNNKTTVIFYYTAFLPGVLLHELVAWLTAGICNVRAARAVQLPQQEQISALQLGFVRLANSVHPFKRLVIEVAPLFVALFVLWHIAVDILDIGNTWAILASGNLDDVALAISRFTATADFWLWFYLAFSIANTMLPDLPSALKGRKRLSLVIGAMLLASIVLGIGDLRGSAITATVESLLSSLTIILLAITSANLVMVLVLGSIEAIIERVTGHSATFVDGRLRTVTRQEARRLRASQIARRPGQPAAAPRVVQPKSVYALPLPIPGPPGIEPVSRNIAAILDIRSGKSEARASRSEPATIRDQASLRKSEDSKRQPTTYCAIAKAWILVNRREVLAAESAQPAEIPDASDLALDSRVLSDERAPFDRPFAGDEIDLFDGEDKDEAEESKTGFARPFAAPNDSDTRAEASPESSSKGEIKA